jgi:hypothetical protein
MDTKLKLLHAVLSLLLAGLNFEVFCIKLCWQRHINLRQGYGLVFYKNFSYRANSSSYLT